MTSSHIDSYYSRTLCGSASYPVLEDAVEADVCVIGGGLAGIATAMGLAERGKRVVVLEGCRIGWGASGRNGGFVLAGYAAGFDSLVRKVGRGQAQALFALTRNAQSLIRKRIKDHAIACDPVDGMLLASWFDDRAAMQDKAAEMSVALDVPAQFMTKEQVRDICRTQRYHDGVFFPDYFHMHALNYVCGLARALTEKGGRVFEDSLALGIAESESGHIVRTANGTVKAAHVVYCGSAYFNGMERKLARSCLPVSTYVMNTEPLPEDVLQSAITRRYAVRDTRWTDDYYRILPDNSILWGGRVGLGRSVPANLDSAMLADLIKIYPQLADRVKVRTAWAGIMGYTVHKMPHVGQLRPGIWMCTHFGGNGLGPTTAGGEVIAAAIADGDETYKLFAPFGFAWTGGALGPLVAQAVYHSWGLRDSLEGLRYRVKGRAA